MEPLKNFYVTVNIVTWNSEIYISKLLESLKNQTFRDFHIIIIDNGSKDRTLEIAQTYENVTLIRNNANLGFARAHNKGIEMALKFFEGRNLRNRFIFVCNPDIVWAEDCMERMLLHLYREGDIALAGPRLLRLLIEERDNLIDYKKTNIIDSMGLNIFKSRKVTDSFEGAVYAGASGVQETFGVSGALMCFRADALEAARWDKEYFDEDFFAYKEDADICWRLKNLDKRIVIIPEAFAYHHRNIKGDARLTIWNRLKNYRNKPASVRFLSVRNHLWLIFKNDFASNHIIDFPFIFFEELGKFFYCLFFDNGNLRAYFSALTGLPKILQKRGYLKAAKIKPAEIREWIK